MNPLIFEERWLPVTDKSVPNIIPNRYLISDTGKIYSNAKKSLLIPQQYEENGYCSIGLYLKNNVKKKCLMHRLVAIEFIPNENYKNLQVNHFDGNKSNNNVWNLEWVTPSQNIQHAFRRNLVPDRSGENSNSATITNFQAEMIAYLLSSCRYTHKQIADIVNCSINVVHQISKGENWKDIYNQYNLSEYKNKKAETLFTDEQLHMIFKYFEDNKNNYDSLNKLFKETLFNLFNIEINENLYKFMYKLYNRKSHINISDQYDF